MTDDGKLEDAVYRSAHAAALVLHTIERFLPMMGFDRPVVRENRELLWYAANEALDYALAAKARFYEKP